MTGRKSPGTEDKQVLAIGGVAVVAVVCCAALPLLVGVVGGLVTGTILGIGVGVLVAAALVALTLLLGERGRR